MLITNIFRFIFLILLQVMVFKRIAFSTDGLGFAHFLIYPAALLLLPVKTNRALLLLLGFLLGIVIDIFYDSPGIHASASVFTAYIRNVIIAILEPYEGYNQDDVPGIRKMGFSWFLSYVSIAMFLHLFFYFSVDAFSFVFFLDILLNTVFSFFVSVTVIVIAQFIFKSKY